MQKIPVCFILSKYQFHYVVLSVSFLCAGKAVGYTLYLCFLPLHKKGCIILTQTPKQTINLQI
jgi:hypothetical protein